MISVHNHTHLSSETINSIKDEVAHIHSLERLLAHHGAENIVSMLNQDEFTVDVVVKYAESIYLAYDSTWLGAVVAVAIWEHQPTAQDLLEARLARGWQPKPSAINGGEVVLGYAQCVYKG